MSTSLQGMSGRMICSLGCSEVGTCHLKVNERPVITKLIGFLHPIIHLGFGIEFNQPAIIAEALAQAAVHDSWMSRLLVPAEKQAAQTPLQDPQTIVSLLDKCRATPSLREAAASTSNNRIRDGILVKAPQDMLDIVSGYRIPSESTPSDLLRANAEMTNAAAYFTGAAQRPNKQIKMDFYYMHCINCSIFFTAFLDADWLRKEDKIRLLEWKVRTDLALYASRGSPELLIDEIVNYKPKMPSAGQDPWKGIIDRVLAFEDDGHGAKLIRALAHGQQICSAFEDKEEFRIKKDMWLQLGHMTIDSVEAEDGIHWVRSTGFDSAWEEVPDRARL